MKHSIKIATFIFINLICVKLFGQDINRKDYYSNIKNYNLASILTADSFFYSSDKDKMESKKRDEVLGFIGTDYRRFKIHFTKITKNSSDPYNYVVNGQSKFNGTLSSFVGTIRIKAASIAQDNYFPEYQEGIVTCELNIYQDKSIASSGSIKGELKSYFIIDSLDNFYYNGLMFQSDGFSNNEFRGVWTSYNNKISKICNWGDYRIPESGDLDIGAGEFSVSNKYLKNGWESFKLAFGIYPETKESSLKRENSLKIENEKWWE